MKWKRYTLHLIVLVTIVGLAAAGWVIYRLMPLGNENCGVDEFGTALAGIIGTATTTLSLVFIYFAFRDQQRRGEVELFDKLYADLMQDINSIQYRKLTKKGSDLYQGVDALYYYSGDDNINKNSVLNHLLLVVTSFRYLLDVVRAFQYQQNNFISIMRDKIYLLYYSKVLYPVLHGFYEQHMKQLWQDDWGNARILFFEFEKLAQETLRYLDGRGLILIRPAARSRYTDILLKRYNMSWQEHWQQYPPGQKAGTGNPTSVLPTTQPNALGRFMVKHVFNPARRVWHSIGYK